MNKVKSKKKREEENILMLEGSRLIGDAIEAGIKLKCIYFSLEENLVGIKHLLSSRDIKLKKVFYKDLKLFSDHVTCPGVMAIAQKPDIQLNENRYKNEERLPLILIGDNIRDPGNVGTILRSAAAVGIQKVIFTKGCVDPWNPKVLRAGTGAHFRIPIVNDIEWPLIFNHIPMDKPINLFIAESNAEIDSITAYGDATHNQLNIPSHTFHEITKEVNPETNEIILRDESFSDENILRNYRNAPIASYNYSDVNYFSSDPSGARVLIIGGETHGLSLQSYKLAYDYIGRKIKIPLSLGMESLNSAIAASVILYEMKRQYLLSHAS